MDKLGRVYMIISPAGKVYVGSTTKSFEERWRRYKLLDCKRQTKLYNSFIKYGVDKHLFHKVWSGDVRLMLKHEAILGRIWNSLDQTNGLNCKLPKESDEYISVSIDTRNKLSKSGKGRIINKSWRNKIKKAKENRGDKMSKEMKDILIELNSKPVVQFDLDKNFIREWKSISEAGKYLNVKNNHIGCCCNNKRKTSNGYIWKFKQ